MRLWYSRCLTVALAFCKAEDGRTAQLRFRDKCTADVYSSAQHLRHTGGPGCTGKSEVIDLDIFAAKGQGRSNKKCC